LGLICLGSSGDSPLKGQQNYSGIGQHPDSTIARTRTCTQWRTTFKSHQQETQAKSTLTMLNTNLLLRFVHIGKNQNKDKLETLLNVLTIQPAIVTVKIY
jgi:hypothetical protein